MRRIGLLLAALGLVLVIGVGLLVMRALQSIHEEEQLRHEVVASRLFDELERELTALLQREEERSFLEYRTLFVPEGQVPGNPSLSVSPLATGPTDSYVVGWYQVEPDGALNLPWKPRPFEQEYADTNAIVLGNQAPGISDAERTIEALAEPLVQPVRDAWNARRDELDAAGSIEDGKLRKDVDERTVARPPSSPPTSAGKAEAPAKTAEDKVAVVDRSERPAPAADPASTTTLDGRVAGAPSEDADGDGRAAPEAPAAVEEERRSREAQARADAGRLSAQLELEASVQQAEGEARKEADEAPAQSATVTLPPPAPRSTGGRKKKPTAQTSSDRDVLESLNRGGSSRAQRQTKSSAYSSDNADLFKNDQEVALVQGEVVFEPTPGEATEQLALASSEEDLDADGPDEMGGLGGDASPTAPVTTVAAGGEETGPGAGTAPAPVAAPLPERSVPTPAPKPQRRRTIEKQEAPPAAPPTPVELLVTVSPFTSYRPDGEHLVLHRDVHVGPDRYVQGLVVLLPELMQHLHATVVGTDIEDAVQIAWPDIGMATGEPVEARFGFDHTFAEPFGSVTASASLGTLPRPGRDPRSWVVFLALLLAGVGTLGFVGIYRSTAVVVHFAERRNNFVAAVTHELKTPLTAIRMYAEILRDGMVSSDEKRQEYYGTITTESDRLGRLINNVLELSNLEKGSRPMRLEVGSVATVLDEVARVLGPHARDRGFTLVTEVPDDLPPARFDRDALLQVVINLVDNAIKFSDASDDKRILLTASEGLITIRDHGPGVPTAQLNRIFQPFFRGERELTRNTKGTGIGLALVRGLVEQMGGRVIARNHPLGGFEVSIAL